MSISYTDRRLAELEEHNTQLREALRLTLDSSDRYIKELKGQIKLMDDKAATSFNCFWNGGWYSL